jgi:hypothetical protein
VTHSTAAQPAPSPEEVAAILGVPLMPWQRAIVAQALGDEAPMRGYYLTVPHDAGRANLDRLRKEHFAQLALEREKRIIVERRADVERRVYLAVIATLTLLSGALTLALLIGAP